MQATTTRATHPFQFIAASYLIRIRRERSHTLAELTANLREVSDASIFYHTFQSLEEHHYTPFSSEFAQWVMHACNQYPLAEQLAAIDVTGFVSIEELRTTLVRTIDAYLEERPTLRQLTAFEPFYFCEAVEVTQPLEMQATNLAELADGIGKLSLQSLHYHFLNSRLRLHLITNDFSFWIASELGLPDLAAKLNRLDFHTNTLDGLRDEIVAAITAWINR